MNKEIVMDVLLDTNFLLDAAKYRIDVFSELKNPVTLDSCVKELEKIARSRKNDAVHAKIALGMLGSKNIKIIKTSAQGDESVKNYAMENKCAVATNDRELIKSLKKLNIKVIRFRQKKFLMAY